MPKLDVTRKELEIIAHAVELFIQRYARQTEHWRWFSKKYAMQGIEMGLQGMYDGLEDAYSMFVESGQPLIRKLDEALKVDAFNRKDPAFGPPSRPSVKSRGFTDSEETVAKERSDQTLKIKRAKGKGK